MRAEKPRWHVAWKVLKFEGDLTPEECDWRTPYNVVEGEGNILTIGGASALWERLIGTAVSAFNNANAYLGVGDGSTTAADTQTDLQGSNKTRKGMDSTYPQHSDSTSVSSAKSIVYRSTFASGDANHVWDEWGLFNASTSGRMLNRRAEGMGTKGSGTTWQLQVTLSLS